MASEGKDYKIIQVKGFLFPFSGISFGEWVQGMACNECFFVFDVQLDYQILGFRFLGPGGPNLARSGFSDAFQVCPHCGSSLFPARSSANYWQYTHARWIAARLDRQMPHLPRFIESCLLVFWLCIPTRRTVKWSIRVKLN